MIYVASSWRNIYQQATVHILRAAGFEVYDFRNPPDSTGFAWKEVGLPNTTGFDDKCTVSDYIAALETPRATAGFASDMDALKNSDTCILVLPCGASAHLEMGWATGAGKRTCIYAPEETLIPELMYLAADHISPTMMDLLGWLGVED